MLKLNLQQNQKIWFTSDYHINHRNIVRGVSSWDDKTGCRDFETVKDMEDVIVDNYNRLVSKEDIVFNLGDILFGDKSYLPSFLNRLNCRNIHFIKGNHDGYFSKYPEYEKLFLSVNDYLEIVIGKKLLVLFHFPICVWNDSHSGSIHICGHSHGSLPDDPYARRLDVGVDTTWYGHEKFCPYSLDEVLNIMYNVKGDYKPIDHHK